MNHADEIKSKLDIVDIISEYISLKPAGSNFRALCPFHNEKTPSFMVSPDKQIYHCFGCGKGGDLISFVMGMEGLDFVEALKLLAPRAGVIIDNQEFSDNSQKNRLLQIMELSRKYYNYILVSEKGDRGKIQNIKKYLGNRGLSDEAISNWQIGYSLDNYDDLLSFLKSKKFTDTEILLSGMSFKSEKGKHFNRFRDRIMFPINDINGRTVAFTARINPEIKDNKGLGKYINSPQTEIYDKSRILFALDRARMPIKEKDVVVLVEGQMDAISAHEAGFNNVCAVSGTALTVSQLNLIKRYTKNIVLAFDQDSAGENATDRGVSEALRMGFSLKIANLEGGKDPDDIIRENPDNFKKALDSAQDIMNYYLLKEFGGLDINNIKEKNLAVNKILTVINKLYNKVEQDFWLKELSQKARVEEVFLREELQKISQNIGKNDNIRDTGTLIKPLDQEGPISWEDKLMESLLSLLLKNNKYCEYVFNNLNPEFVIGKYQEFYNYWLIYYNKEGRIEYQGLLNYFKQENLLSLEEAIKKIGLISDFYWSDEEVSEEKTKEEIIKNIVEIKKNFLREKIRTENDNLIKAERDNNDKSIQDIMKNLKKYNQELQKII
ncbi:MAG TPA: DNA primase [bacterium]|nr:DNA primase [bacterium]